MINLNLKGADERDHPPFNFDVLFTHQPAYFVADVKRV
jgi:hypothetical protein